MRLGGDACERLSSLDQRAGALSNDDPVFAAHAWCLERDLDRTDALRRKRNLNDYTGAPLQPAEAG
jgi:hypothetical protein